MVTVRDLSYRFLGTAKEPTALWQHFRRRRFEMLCERFPTFGEMSVLDLGGTPVSWRFSPVKPATLTVVNLWLPPVCEGIGADREVPDVDAVSLEGDATDPDLLCGQHFNLIYCNSLIEHITDDDARDRLADNVSRLGTHHWVQTPNRHFPIEMHWRFPGFQYLPVRVQAQIARCWDAGGFTSRGRTLVEAIEQVESVDLLDDVEMRRYFPSSALVRERFGGVTKSLIAVA